MFGALDAGNIGNQHGLVLSGVKVPPFALPLLVPGQRSPALRAGQSNGGIVFDKDTDFAGREGELHFGTLQGA